MCLGKKRKQTWSALFPNNAPFRIKSEFPGFEFWSSDFVYSHITWKYNSPKQSGLFSFASHCCLDIIHLWGNLGTPPSTFAFECIQFIDVTQVHYVLIATFIQNLWRVYKLYIFGKFRVWWTPKPVFPFFFKVSVVDTLDFQNGHLPGLVFSKIPMINQIGFWVKWLIGYFSSSGNKWGHLQHIKINSDAAPAYKMFWNR